MRTSFINNLFEKAKKDSRINLIVADLGFSVVDDFAEQLPDQFLNAGVAEQNMTSIAAGISKINNNTCFTYSIANFPVMRCMEQIRNDVCHNSANVKIVVVGGGVSYGTQGYSHYAIEDLAMMRALPDMIVTAPSDPIEVKAIVDLACDTHGPWYIRLGKSGEPSLHKKKLKNFKIGKSITICDGNDGTIISTGAITYEAYLSIQELKKSGINIRLISMPFVKPIDKNAIQKAASETKWIITLEEHSGFGGLGSAVAEILSQKENTPPLHRLFLPETVMHIVGSQEYLRNRFKIDSEGILKYIRSNLLK